jgi:hypothetical protein
MISRLGVSLRPQGYPELRYPVKDHEMPLTFPGESLKTINSTEYRAIGSHGELVIVEASDEALQHYGEVAVQQKASAKYDLMEVQSNRVTVKTTDFH